MSGHTPKRGDSVNYKAKECSVAAAEEDAAASSAIDPFKDIPGLFDSTDDETVRPQQTQSVFKINEPPLEDSTRWK